MGSGDDRYQGKKITLGYNEIQKSRKFKNILYNYIILGTNISHEGWEGYVFLNSDDSVFTEEKYLHARGNFCF